MRTLFFLVALLASAPALAQHQGHEGHEDPASKEETTVDPHAGHQMPAEAPADPHAGHVMSDASAGPQVAPAPAAAAAGPEHAADSVYGAEAMAEARRGMRREHGDMRVSKFMLDRLEWRSEEGRDGYAWDAEAWHGGDVDKLWLKSEGEGAFGEAPERIEVQALWSRAIDPWFDIQLGLRHDFRPDPERTHLVVGVGGLAPYWFEIGAAAFVSDKGEVSVRLEAEYDLRLTQRLILQPAVELEVSLQNVPELGLGSGVSSGEAGLRMRYELKREFAPYLGVEFERAFTGTARDHRAAGEEAGGWRLVAGVRAWF
jgi:copper resistance protein B